MNDCAVDLSITGRTEAIDVTASVEWLNMQHCCWLKGRISTANQVITITLNSKPNPNLT